MSDSSSTYQSFIGVFQEVLAALEHHQLPYMVVGSVASIIYGEPRLTKDMDLVIDILLTDTSKFETLFSEEDYYVPPAEVLRDEISGSEKHLSDIRGILTNTSVDRGYLDHWVNQLGLTKQFAMALV